MSEKLRILMSVCLKMHSDLVMLFFDFIHIIIHFHLISAVVMNCKWFLIVLINILSFLKTC